MGSRDYLGHLLLLFHVHQQEAGLEVEQPGLHPALLRDACITGCGLRGYITIPALELSHEVLLIRHREDTGGPSA